MVKEQFERAKKIEDSLQHIDNVLNFLRNVNDSKVLAINMVECGFVPHPNSERMTREDIIFVIQAYENEKERLIREFDRL